MTTPYGLLGPDEYAESVHALMGPDENDDRSAQVILAEAQVWATLAVAAAIERNTESRPV